MAFFTWKDSFNTGIREIDTQHRSIVDTINALYDSNGSQDRKRIAATIADLSRYTIEHFSLEENLFQSVSFPDQQAHCRQHDLFREKLVALQADFDQGRSGVMGDTLQFLKDWFMNHILSEDMKYKPYVGTINELSILY